MITDPSLCLKMTTYVFVKFPNGRLYSGLSSCIAFAPFLEQSLILVLLQGANFRDLPGVVVGADNVVRPHPTENIPLLPSGKRLVNLYIAFIAY